jgi:L-lactate dehydrogenase complex protein LldE
MRPASRRNYPARPKAVYFFATCLVDQFAPQAGLAAVRLIEREGVAVHFPESQTCCGQPAYSSGYAEAARAVAAAQLVLFPEPWPVVVPSGSCAAMMRCHYPALFAEDPARLALAEDLAARVFEFTEFLVHVLGFARADLGEPCKVALHTSCHARRQIGVHETSAALIEGLKHVELAEPARSEECCGFGGTFALSHPELSEAIVADKVAALRATGASHVVSADCGCLLNIAGRAAREDEISGTGSTTLPGEHIASFLWRRTGEGEP